MYAGGHHFLKIVCEQDSVILETLCHLFLLLRVSLLSPAGSQESSQTERLASIDSRSFAHQTIFLHSTSLYPDVSRHTQWKTLNPKLIFLMISFLECIPLTKWAFYVYISLECILNIKRVDQIAPCTEEETKT